VSIFNPQEPASDDGPDDIKIKIRCSFTFDEEQFPDPKAYISEIKGKYGVKICLWSV
jgi:alpha-glucosidase (family GH31 glycosyl hydrolase)